MIVARDDESDTDVRVSELILGLTDMSLLVCLGFIKVNADLVASWSERGIAVSTLEYQHQNRDKSSEEIHIIGRN